MSAPSKADALRALMAAGFAIGNAETKTNYFAVEAARRDLFGVPVLYLVSLAENRLSPADVESLKREAERRKAHLVIVFGDGGAAGQQIECLTYAQFIDRLGGGVLSLLPMEPEYSPRLETLGRNEVPTGLVGKADDLFEVYVHTGFQFLFRSRVIRYGQDRRGEEVPDGVAVSHTAPLLLYDAKAAAAGFSVSASADRQFADYVLDFNRKYERLVGRVTAFVVVSSSFADSAESLEKRYFKLIAEAQTPLAFLTTQELATMIRLLVDEPLYRTAVDWRLVFSKTLVDAADVEKQLRALRKDGVISPVGK